MQPDSIQRRPRGLFGLRAQARAPLPSAPVSDKQPPPPPDAAAARGDADAAAELAVTRLCSVKQAAPVIEMRLYCQHYGNKGQSALGTVHELPLLLKAL